MPPRMPTARRRISARPEPPLVPPLGPEVSVLGRVGVGEATLGGGLTPTVASSSSGGVSSETMVATLTMGWVLVDGGCQDV